MKVFKTLAAGAAMMVAGFSPALAQTSYEGEQVTLLINYGAGGSTDVEGRLIANHLGKHIPGNPDIIVQNMPGGGGNIGSNYLGTSADADGMTVGFFTWNPIDQIIEVFCCSGVVGMTRISSFGLFGCWSVMGCS